MSLSTSLLVALSVGACSIPSKFKLRDSTPNDDSAIADAGTNDTAVNDVSDSGRVWQPTPGALANLCILTSSCRTDTTRDDGTTDCLSNIENLIGNGAREPQPLYYSVWLYELLTRCSEQAFNCESFRQCLRGNQDLSTVCANDSDAGSTRLRCLNNHLVFCGSSDFVYAIDCTAHGMTCMSTANYAYCTSGTCSGSPSPTCAGSLLQRCVSNLNSIESVDCTRVAPGAECQMVNDPDAGSVGACVHAASPACLQPNPRCDGNTLVECEPLTQRELRTNCETLKDGTCQTQGATATCVPNVTECNDTYIDTCASSTEISYCLNRRIRTFSCPALGFTRCRPGVPTDGGVTNALCAN